MDHCKLDPDYESYNSALELNEKEDKKENLLKIKQIIEVEYNREIIQRQEQIEQIELQICKVRKLLHLLRYTLVMSYYKKKELEYSGTEDECSTSDTFIVPDKQNRIHPAVKKLLGKNVNNLDHLNIKDKRKSNARLATIQKADEILPESKKIKLEEEQVPVREKNNQVKNHSSLEFIRNRKKTKYRVVVGNISKWMPSSEEDILTHKWMVYVRGPKEKPDVSHFIDKVIFYLHPSYKPHDVVEVSESPFHLARRGWGEFPVRVQIFFKVTLNKPIDVVHNIKLDKTYTGRQTLGNETLIDVFLYDEFEPDNPTNLMETEDIKIKKEPVLPTASTSAEHDYCTGQVTNHEVPIDHSYCLSSPDMQKIKSEKVEQDESNLLIYGLDHRYSNSESEPNKIKTLITNNLNQLIHLNRKDIKFNNTKIILLGKNIDSVLLTKLLQSSVKVNSNKSEQNFRISLPKNSFKNMGEALPYLFKKLPLYSELANDVNYKRLYPFTASTLKEYVSWNVGKRRSAEWSRAKTIKNILASDNIFGVENWNTKAILMYGRSHDHTPFISYGLFQRESDEKSLLMSCYQQFDPTRKTFKLAPTQETEITVNVDSDDVSSPPKKQNGLLIDISDPNLKLECSYIRQTALDSGVILKPEEIDEGVKVNGAELMIFAAVKCLAENLIRRAKNHRVCTKFLSPSTSAINREDVEVAINERPEMMALRIFTNERRNAEYFS